jgi:hypothetical protein
MAFSGEYMVPIEDAQKLERDLAQSKEANAGLMRACDNLESEIAEAKERMLNNPFCSSCKELDCCVSGDGTCAMIRKYLKVAEITKQRDALADALRTASERFRNPKYGCIWDDAADDIDKTLSAVKGGASE